MNWYCNNKVWQDGAGRAIPTAPLQLNPHDKTIPIEVAAEGWKEYAAQGHGSQSLERMNQRGGFSATELAILLYERIKRIEAARPEEKDMVPLGTISQCPSCEGDGKLTTTPGQFGPCWRCGGHGRVMAYTETQEQFEARMKKVNAFVAGCASSPQNTMAQDIANQIENGAPGDSQANR